MQLADLVFILLFFTAVGTLLTATGFAMRRQFDRARRILFRLFVGGVVYFSVVIVASAVLPRRVLKTGDPQCFDDYCVSLAGFQQAPQGSQVSYRIDVRLFSRARRISQRENNLAVYLVDDRGRRYDPVAAAGDKPFNVLLGPRESAVISRSFLVPSSAANIGAVLTHEGGFPIGWLILGYDTWFRKPAIVRLQ